MATIEITATVAGLAFTALASLLTATWALSRRSRGWDESTLITRGDPATGKKSLNDRVTDIETREIPTIKDTLHALAEHMKWLKRALNAHGSDEHDVADGVARTLDAVAREQARLEIESHKKQAERIRKQIMLEQESRFVPPRADDEFVENVIDAFVENAPASSEPPGPTHRAINPRNTGRFGPDPKKR